MQKKLRSKSFNL